MESIKAIIEGDGVKSSVEFSVEELIANRQGKPWGELNDAQREAEMKDYARFLFMRDGGGAGELRVHLEGGTFSQVRDLRGGDANAAQAGHSTQSDYSLSQSEADSNDSGDEDGRFRVAEEVNLDQQSDRMRHVGQMPPDMGRANAADAVGKSMKRD